MSSLRDEHRRWPRFETLCDRAKHKSLGVLLGVTKNLIVSDKGKEQRALHDIRVTAGDSTIATAIIRNGDIDEAAALLLQRIA